MKQLPNVDITTDTFYSWIVKFNNVITLANTEIVTANNSANGATTTGVGYVIGSFGSNTVVCSTLAGGNTIATGPLTVSTNTTFSDQVIKVNNGMTYGANGITHNHGITMGTSNTSTQAVDTFATTVYRTAKYVISVTDPVNSAYQSTEIMLLHDGTTTYTTEYATVNTGTSLATFSSDILAGNARLLVTPSVANVQINVARTLISI